MKKKMWTIALGVLGVGLLGVAVLALLSILSRRPDNLGVVDGKLADCPDTPNCVSSFAADPAHHIDPIPFTGSPAEAFQRLKSIVAAVPRATIVTSNDRYMHVEFTSAIFRFVDDGEFLLDPDRNVIQVRSASRAGRSDLGVNRRRVESIRKEFELR